MDKAYEEAAFALEIGGTSDVVRTDNGYYIIQRYEKDVSYMNTYFEQCASNIAYAKFLEILDGVKANIKLELSDFGKSLDILTLMPDKTLSTAK